MSLEFDLELPRRDFLLKIDGRFDGGITGIFGHSGAGKTSFFHMICGLEKPRCGSIGLNGQTLTDSIRKIHVPVHKRRIGVVFQDKRLFPHMTVRENLLFGTKYRKEQRIALSEAVDLLDLASLLDSYPREISGGEEQRTAIGRALLASPELLLLDEPFTGVDNSRRITMLPYLKRLRDHLKIPLLVISHDLPDIQKLTSTVFMMEKGRCSGYGEISDLLDSRGEILSRSGMVNAFRISGSEEISPGLYDCAVKGSPRVRLKVPFLAEGGSTLILPPREISLSRSRIENITIQNQIPGRIIRMYPVGNRLFCRIEGDLTLTAEITREGSEELKLKEGEEVWCLFKAHGLSG
jgi:molybdate transport system ATP-binding protein